MIEKLEIMQAVTRLRKAGLLRTVDASLIATHEYVKEVGTHDSGYLGHNENELEDRLSMEAMKPVTLRKYTPIKFCGKIVEHKIIMTAEVLDLPALEILLEGEKWGHPC